MTLEHTQFFMIEALGGDFKKKSLSSFSETFSDLKIDEISIVKEKNSREETLNLILQSRNINKDIFIFVDDIVFLDGWSESLAKNAQEGLIVGFSMLQPDGKTVQDFGYDLIKIDENLSSLGLYKGELTDKRKLPSYRYCSAVCGCAMWISKKVTDKIDEFPLEGSNRWGEMIYSDLARKKGFKTIVLGTHLIHHGTSTKQNKDLKLSSNSWLYENVMWTNVASKFFYDLPFTKNIKSRFSTEFIETITSSKRLLIYGCGTVSDFVTKNYLIEKKTDYASTLPEEIGKKFHNNNIQDFNKIDLNNYDQIFISSVGYEKKVIDLIPQNIRNKILCVRKTVKKNYIDYAICDYHVFLVNQ